LIIISALCTDDFFHFFNDIEELKKVKNIALNAKYKKRSWRNKRILRREREKN